MIEITYTIKADFSVDVHRSGAKYTLDGIHFMNGGNINESARREYLGKGFTYDKNAVPFDIGSDIEEYHESVKSGHASLASIFRNEKSLQARNEIITEYFERCVSTRWCFVVRNGKTCMFYLMNRNEFAEFLDLFSTMERESGKTYYKVKIKPTNNMMREWLATMSR